MVLTGFCRVPGLVQLVDMAPEASALLETTHRLWPMSSTIDHSSQLLEELVAEEIALQIDQIAESLQREGWPMPLVKRFMHRAVENLPE